MGAGRPPKQGLSYHSSDVDYYEDFKIMDLMDKYGPLGQTIYDVILKMVYRNGYYLEIPKYNLALSVTKTIGNKWIKNKDFVLQVVQYCADIGLFDDALLQQSVITSVGIQKRYSLATVRNKVNKEKYWLLKKESEKFLLSVPQNSISDTQSIISVTEIQNSDTKIPIKEKESKLYMYIFQNPEVENAFQRYLLVRQKNKVELCEEQIQALRKELLTLSDNEEEQLAIINKATIGNWNSFYKLKSKNIKEPKSEQKHGKNKFNNFKGRSYDYDSLERQLLDVNLKQSGSRQQTD